MASFNSGKASKLKQYKRFFGLNESLGETSLKDGEATIMKNWKITENYELQKREGYELFYDFLSTREVVNMWFGKLGTATVYELAYFVVLEVIGTVTDLDKLHIYRYNFATSTMDYIGFKNRFFDSELIQYGQNIILRTDYEFATILPLTGTSFVTPSYYIPRKYIECTPTFSTFTDLEELNALSNSWYQESVGNGAAAQFTVANPTSGLLLSVLKVWKNGVLLTVTTDYSFNNVTNILTMVVVPAIGDIIKIEVNSSFIASYALNTLCFTNLFGKASDTRYFVFGGEKNETKNIMRWSDSRNLLYFPVTNYSLVGGDGDKIMCLLNQYDKQIVFLDESTYYTIPEFSTITNQIEFPIFRMNDSVGSDVVNQVALVKNSPVTLFKNSIRIWTPTNVVNEINENNISTRISASLEKEDLSKAVMYDNARKKELFINIGTNVYVWNYEVNVYYMFTEIHANCFFEYKNILYFGGSGKLFKFGGTSDNGVAINAECELCFTDFSEPTLMKNSRKLFVTLKPLDRTSVRIEFETDRKTGIVAPNNPVGYNLISYNFISYSDWTYNASGVLKKFKRRFRASKYSFIKFKLINNELEEAVVILEISIEAETTGEVK